MPLQPGSPSVVLVSALCPLCWQFWVPHAGMWPGVGWVCVTSLPLSSPSLAPCISWGSPHLLQGCAGEGFGMTSIAWSGAEQSFNSNPPSGGHHGDREEVPRAGKGLQGMTQAGEVQYSCSSLCTDPSVALGFGFESEFHSQQRRERCEEQGMSDASCCPASSALLRRLATF